MEAAKRRALEQVDQVERDMRDLERIANKYNLVVYVPPETFAPSGVESTNRPVATQAQAEGEAIIRTTGHPLPISELLHRLIERGMDFGASPRDPANALSAMLARNPRLRFLPKLGWWLRDVSWPPKPNEIGHIAAPPTPSDETETSLGGGRRRSPEKKRLYQALRNFLENAKEPVAFREIYDHLVGLGIPLHGKNPRQSLSAFMTSIHEFRSHGPTGRGGWTFTADPNWDVEKGFKGEEDTGPAWQHNPVKLKLFEATREILKNSPGRIKLENLFASVKATGVDFTGVKHERSYFANLLNEIPCFETKRRGDEAGPAGWRYVAELDDTAASNS